jgi:hypothetical protein
MLPKREKTGTSNKCTPKDVIQLLSSIIFLGLASYIAFFLEAPKETPRQDLYMIASLTGSYGLWKLWKGISGCRSN